MIGAADWDTWAMEVLHRTVRVIDIELMEIDADQKHVPQLLKDLGLTQSNIVKTPRMKLSASEAETIENSPILDGEQATTFRSGTMRCAYLAQDRVDISERSNQMSCTSDVETESRTHDTIETSCEVLERSAKKSIAVHRARTMRSSLGSARGQRLGWRHSNESKHVWSDRAERSTFAQTQFNSSKRDWTQ